MSKANKVFIVNHIVRFFYDNNVYAPFYSKIKSASSSVLIRIINNLTFILLITCSYEVCVHIYILYI